MFSQVAGFHRADPSTTLDKVCYFEVAILYRFRRILSSSNYTRLTLQPPIWPAFAKILHVIQKNLQNLQMKCWKISGKYVNINYIRKPVNACTVDFRFIFGSNLIHLTGFFLSASSNFVLLRAADMANIQIDFKK